MIMWKSSYKNGQNVKTSISVTVFLCIFFLAYVSCKFFKKVHDDENFFYFYFLYHFRRLSIQMLARIFKYSDSINNL